jgi:hypothetical protein
MEVGKINFGPALVNGVGPNKARELWQAAQAVNVAESSSPMPGLLPKQEPEDYLIRLVQMANLLETFEEALTRVENRMTKQAAQIALMQATLNRLVDSLAEDQDPDEMPARYMDGSPV